MAAGLSEVKAALVDDDPLILQLLGRSLQRQGIDVMWTANGADHAMLHLRQSGHHPDVIAIDVRMPGTDGHQLTAHIREEFAGSTDAAMAVVMLTTLDDPCSMSSAVASGAVGYLVKTDAPEAIALGLRCAAAGLHVFSASASRSLSTDVQRHHEHVSPLTPREMEVLQLMSQSLTNAQIAGRLHLSVLTIKHHVSSILHKLRVPDRVGAVMWGVRNDIIR